MNRFKVLVPFALMLLLLTVAPVQAQEFTPGAAVGAAYYTSEAAPSYRNIAGSVKLYGATLFDRLGGGSVVEVSYDSGFKYSVFVRGEFKLNGKMYTAVDTRAYGGEKDPRAVFGYFLRKDIAAEAYARVDGTQAYGVAVHYELW